VLTSIRLDDNGVTHLGLRELANALGQNTTVKELPLPLADIAAAMAKNGPSTVAEAHRIQAAVANNKSPARHWTHQAAVVCMHLECVANAGLGQRVVRTGA
jgi:hypothetical protein